MSALGNEPYLHLASEGRGCMKRMVFLQDNVCNYFWPDLLDGSLPCWFVFVCVF